MTLSFAQPKSEERTAESAQNVPNDELISKKAAIDAHCELCEDKGFCGDICPDVEVFRLIPSAQPELIRCKDCKYADDDGVCQNSVGLAIQDDDDFCSRAERRTDGTD